VLQTTLVILQLVLGQRLLGPVAFLVRYVGHRRRGRFAGRLHRLLFFGHIIPFDRRVLSNKRKNAADGIVSQNCPRPSLLSRVGAADRYQSTHVSRLAAGETTACPRTIRRNRRCAFVLRPSERFTVCRHFSRISCRHYLGATATGGEIDFSVDFIWGTNQSPQNFEIKIRHFLCLPTQRTSVRSFVPFKLLLQNRYFSSANKRNRIFRTV